MPPTVLSDTEETELEYASRPIKYLPERLPRVISEGRFATVTEVVAL